MSAPTEDSHPTTGDVPRGYSLVDAGTKIGLFALIGGILYLGAVETSPLSFYDAIFGSMIIGFLLLTFMGVSVPEVWNKISGE